MHVWLGIGPVVLSTVMQDPQELWPFVGRSMSGRFDADMLWELSAGDIYIFNLFTPSSLLSDRGRLHHLPSQGGL